jgi:hypothetical protein
MTPVVVGKSAEKVVPAIYAYPEESTAIAFPLSPPVPPIRVAYEKLVPAAFTLTTNAACDGPMLV